MTCWFRQKYVPTDIHMTFCCICLCMLLSADMIRYTKSLHMQQTYLVTLFWASLLHAKKWFSSLSSIWVLQDMGGWIIIIFTIIIYLIQWIKAQSYAWLGVFVSHSEVLKQAAEISAGLVPLNPDCTGVTAVAKSFVIGNFFLLFFKWYREKYCSCFLFCFNPESNVLHYGDHICLFWTGCNRFCTFRWFFCVEKVCHAENCRKISFLKNFNKCLSPPELPISVWINQCSIIYQREGYKRDIWPFFMINANNHRSDSCKWHVNLVKNSLVFSESSLGLSRIHSVLILAFNCIAAFASLTRYLLGRLLLLVTQLLPFWLQAAPRTWSWHEC